MPTPLVLITRQDTHIGSLWLSQLLARHNVSVFFQPPGVCNATAEGHDLDARVASLRRLSAEGCGCLHVDTISRSPTFCNHGCSADALKHATPARKNALFNLWGARHEVETIKRAARSCRAVAAMGVPLPTAAKARRMRLASVVAYGRRNSAKRAISQFKELCRTPYLANHASEGSRLASVRTLALIEPALLLSEIQLSARRREDFQRALSDDQKTPPRWTVDDVVDYEEVQSAEHQRVRSLLDAVGISGFATDGAAVSAREAQIVKSSDDDLSRFLLNFDAMNASAARWWPCIQAQLASRSPADPLPTCGRSTQPQRSPRQRGGAVKAVMVQCQRRQCMHVYGTRLPTKPTNFTECFGEISTGDALCALAESRLVPTKAGSPESPDAVQVCVVTSFNTSEAWLQGNALAALSSADSS